MKEFNTWSTETKTSTQQKNWRNDNLWSCVLDRRGHRNHNVLDCSHCGHCNTRQLNHRSHL